MQGFFDVMRPLQLGGKLACVLVQLPPKFAFDPETLDSFLKLVDPIFKYSVEFRHISWMNPETWKLLEKHGAAYVNVDEPLLPPEVHLTSDFTYFRWHGRGEKPWFDYRYSKEELDDWVMKVRESASKVKKVYGYFNNHFHGYAPENCLQLLEKLGLLTAEQRQLKNAMGGQSKLGDYFS